MNSLKLQPKSIIANELQVEVPTSKSINNRLLILKYLYFPNLKLLYESDANDTVLLKKILSQESFEGEINAQDAGTAYRFLTALLSCVKSDCELTGTQRMLQRPIGGLVDALKQLGCDIEYANQDGFPPLHIKGKQPVGGILVKPLESNSSQFYSALAMIAPYCKEGLSLEIPSNLGSKPYWEMTLACMKELGIVFSQIAENTFHFPAFKTATDFIEIKIEKDWSAASFWLLLPLLKPEVTVTILGLKIDSIQGDASFLTTLAPSLGLKVLQTETSVQIRKFSEPNLPKELDFKNAPDISMNVIIVLALLGINIQIKGLESLSIKESDRTAVLNSELQKLGVEFIQEKDLWVLNASRLNLPKQVLFDSHDDHRIAMAFSFVGLKTDCEILNPEVVKKSYPNFWQELSRVLLIK